MARKFSLASAATARASRVLEQPEGGDAGEGSWFTDGGDGGAETLDLSWLLASAQQGANL